MLGKKNSIIFMGHIPVMKATQCQTELKVESSTAYLSFGIFEVQEKLYRPGCRQLIIDNATSPAFPCHLDRKFWTDHVY